MTDKFKKLPKDIQMMVEKGNLVSAIKTLASEENISMDEAKALIDNYEEQVKAERHKKQEIIAQKQAKKSAKKQIKSSKSSEVKEQNPFDDLNSNLDQHLSQQGYEKPLVPYWWKRVALILLVVALIVAVLFML